MISSRTRISNSVYTYVYNIHSCYFPNMQFLCYKQKQSKVRNFPLINIALLLPLLFRNAYNSQLLLIRLPQPFMQFLLLIPIIENAFHTFNDCLRGTKGVKGACPLVAHHCRAGRGQHPHFFFFVNLSISRNLAHKFHGIFQLSAPEKSPWITTEIPCFGATHPVLPTCCGVTCRVSPVSGLIHLFHRFGPTHRVLPLIRINSPSSSAVADQLAEFFR